MPSAQPRRSRRRILRIALALTIFAVAFELGVRFLLFDEHADGWAIAHALRMPERFARGSSDDLYWQLEWRFKSPLERVQVPNFDPVLGWKSDKIVLPDYGHVLESELGDRRPILLFGDSYVACMTPSAECFEGLFAETPLAAKYALFNYGVGGFGLDQIALLVEHALPHWAARKPIVVVGVMIDDDLDRSTLTIRDWPKPHFRFENGELVADPIPEPSSPEFAARLELPAVSYGLRLFEHASRRFPWNTPDIRGTSKQENAKVDLNRRILERLTAKLRAADVEFFFVLFHYEESVLHPSVAGWRSAFLHATLDDLHVPWVATNTPMAEKAHGDPNIVASYFGGTTHTRGHFNAEGNRIAFHVILDGLKRFCDLPIDDAALASVDRPRGKLLHVERFDEKILRGKSAAVRYEFGNYKEFPEPADTERLCIRVGEDGPTEVRWKLDRRASEFSARLEMYPGPGDAPNCGKAAVHFVADGIELASIVLERGDAERPVRVELKDRENFSIVVDDAGDGPQCDSIVLLAPKLE